MEGLTEGRIVHYVMSDGAHRPAIVVHVDKFGGDKGIVNLQVFTDGPYDEDNEGNGTIWKPGVHFDDQGKAPNTWHWIERA